MDRVHSSAPRVQPGVLKTPAEPAQTATVAVDFVVAGQPLHAEIPVSTAPVSVRHLLPCFQSLTDTVVEIATDSAAKRGETITCRCGCGACCRQLVPISGAEARALYDLIAALPEPRRSTIRTRFNKARRRLRKAGLLETVQSPDRVTVEELSSLATRYISAGVACPFLESESCSIYSDRPLSCREYLVTSPARHCAKPTAQTVRQVPLPVRVSNAVARLGQPHPRKTSSWVPLILLPEWVETHLDEPLPRPGPELLREFFQKLGGAGETIS